MEADVLFALNEQRWHILRAMKKGYNNPTDIAKETQLSIAYVAQQLHLLEAYGLICREEKKTGKIGKPRSTYTFRKHWKIVGEISPKDVSIRLEKKRKIHHPKAHCVIGKEDDYYLQKMYYLHEEILGQAKNISFLESNPDEIHLLLIGSEELIELIRTEKSNFSIENQKGEKKEIIIWSHTVKEIQDGLANNETYFVQKMLVAQEIVGNQPLDTIKG